MNNDIKGHWLCRVEFENGTTKDMYIPLYKGLPNHISVASFTNGLENFKKMLLLENAGEKRQRSKSGNIHKSPTKEELSKLPGLHHWNTL